MADDTRDGEGWEDLRRQLREALRGQGLGEDADLEEAIAEGLREVLDALAGALDEEDDDEAPAPPPVTVVEGGGEAEGPAPRPDLRVASAEDAEAEAPAEEPDGDGATDEPPTGEAPIPVIRISRRDGRWQASALGRGAERRRLARRVGHDEGRVACREPGAGQTVFFGPEPRAYRLACDGGRLRVVVDGQEVDTLAAGQTMDVEGRRVSVAAAEAPATGAYRRLPPA